MTDTYFPDRYSSATGDLPEDVRLAFLEILYHTLIYIRIRCDQQRVCFIHADHAHNIPHLLSTPKPELLAYYWDVERPIFIRDMEKLNESVGCFEVSWRIIEQEYHWLRERARPAPQLL